MARRKRDRRAPLKRLRRTWTRSPVERPHSTKKGTRGYDRRRDRQPPDLQAEVG